LNEVVEEAAFLAFLALGSREGLSAGPYVEGYLGDTLLFTTDVLGGVFGSELDSTRAFPILTTRV